MKAESKYLLFAYVPIILVIIYVVLCITFIDYGPLAEAGTMPIKLLPYPMILIALSSLAFSNKYLRSDVENKFSWKIITFKMVKIFPAIFLSCLQLYAALMFLGLI